MRKALRHAGISPGQMAAYLGVGGNTVSTWINGKIGPSTQTLRLWALRTGVSYEWLAGDQFPRRRGFRTGPSTTPWLTSATLAALALAA
jgi:transcriptional regulator with XRE-family HTH domain